VTPERFQRIAEVFDAAVDAPPDDRAALLDRLCGDDAAVRTKVERLLAASPGAPQEIGRAIAHEATLIARERAPRRIEPYRLTRELRTTSLDSSQGRSSPDAIGSSTSSPPAPWAPSTRPSM
jgi:serine/threonine-protein kinase